MCAYSFSLRQCLSQLRELIRSGIEVNIIFQFIDRALQNIPKENRLSDQIQTLTQQLKNTKKMNKQLSKENLTLKDMVRNIKIDLEMAGIKSKDMERDLKELRHQKLRQERNLRKQEETPIKEVEIQCQLLSSTLFQEIVSLYKMTKNQNQTLSNFIAKVTESQEQQFQENISEFSNDSTEIQDSFQDCPIICQTPDLSVAQQIRTEKEQTKQTESLTSNSPQNIFSWLKTQSHQLILQYLESMMIRYI